MISKLDEFMFLMGLENTYMPNEYWAPIFHYTSPSGMTSILFDDSEKITLWASRFDCLNDISEGTIAEQVFLEVCQELHDDNQISDELYALISKVAPARTILVHTTSNHTTRVTRAECDRFITSFSKNPDSLAMWNYYSKGSKYEGFNLGFEPSFVMGSLNHSFCDKEIVTHIYPVIYRKEEQKALIRPLILKLHELYQQGYGESHETSIRYVVSNQLTDWKLIFKREYFQHEEEVRIITDVAKRTKDCVPLEPATAIKYRHNCGYFIPYIELKLDKECLTDVNIGPLQCDVTQKENQKVVLEEMLSAHGYSAIENYSKIPVRY